MKIYLKENKELKIENEKLKAEIKNSEEDHFKHVQSVREYYIDLTNKRIKEIENEYKQKLSRKEKLIEIIENLENNINNQIKSLLDLDITREVDNYIKLLKILKEEE